MKQCMGPLEAITLLVHSQRSLIPAYQEIWKESLCAKYSKFQNKWCVGGGVCD